jgi:PDZ domain-containing protein
MLERSTERFVALGVALMVIAGCGASWRELNSGKGKSSMTRAQSTQYIKPVGGSLPQGPALIIETVPASPAAGAGLQAGDTLLSVDGGPVKDRGTFVNYLQQLPPSASVRVLVGTKSGRRDTLVALRESSPRFGVSMAGVATTDTLVWIDDVALGFSGYVSRWSGLTVVRVDLFNRGGTPLVFGPDSVTVTSGDGEVLVPLTPEQVIAMKYGGRVTDVASDVPGSMAEAIVGGASAGIARGMREATTKGVFANALRRATVPAGTRHGGALFIGRKTVTQPIVVHISQSGRAYTMRFGATNDAP